MNVERISAITIKASDMAKSVHFYNKLLGLKILYGGQEAYFSGPQARKGCDPRKARRLPRPVWTVIRSVFLETAFPWRSSWFLSGCHTRPHHESQEMAWLLRSRAQANLIAGAYAAQRDGR
jgi:catechol 2,3-dioxygenase-like lactoylglutathione lyase family enzyme